MKLVFKLNAMSATIELQGLIAGLSEVVIKGLNHKSKHSRDSSWRDMVNNRTKPTPVVTQNPNLRLPILQFPTFRQDTTVQDDISYFMERFHEQTAHLTASARQALLEQQCVGEWPRSVLSFCRPTEGFNPRGNTAI